MQSAWPVPAECIMWNCSSNSVYLASRLCVAHRKVACRPIRAWQPAFEQQLLQLFEMLQAAMLMPHTPVSTYKKGSNTKVGLDHNLLRIVHIFRTLQPCVRQWTAHLTNIATGAPSRGNCAPAAPRCKLPWSSPALGRPTAVQSEPANRWHSTWGPVGSHACS